jgi:hypothetical protein
MDRSWTGMQQIFIARDHNVIVLGENHKRAKGSADVLLELLKSYRNVNVYAELTVTNDNEMNREVPADRSILVPRLEQANSTIEGLYIQKQLHDVPNTIKIVCCNQRSSPPFSIFYLLSNLPFFKEVHHLHRLYVNETERNKYVRAKARKFEELFTENVKSREDTLQFWRTLVRPDMPEPVWYQDCVLDILKYIPRNEVKVMLEMLREKQPIKYTSLIETFEAFLKKLFDDSEHHSRALSKIRRRVNKRVAKGDVVSLTPVILKDATKLSEYFQYMQMFVQDVYMLAQYMLNRDSATHHVFLVGAAHCPFLVYFLQHDCGMTFDMWEGKDIVTNEETKKVSKLVMKSYAKDLDAYIQEVSPKSV